jgi:molybdopterin converting factor small subunit
LIVVKCLGHIGSTVGSKEVRLDEAGLEAADLIDHLRRLSGKEEPGFDKYNTLVLVEDGEAFVPASRSRVLEDGERVVLIPFSHGG